MTMAVLVLLEMPCSVTDLQAGKNISDDGDDDANKTSKKDTRSSLLRVQSGWDASRRAGQCCRPNGMWVDEVPRYLLRYLDKGPKTPECGQPTPYCFAPKTLST